MGGQFVQTVPKLFVQTVLLFGWVVFRVGLPFLNIEHAQLRKFEMKNGLFFVFFCSFCDFGGTRLKGSFLKGVSHTLALGKWGRTQMGSDRLNRILFESVSTTPDPNTSAKVSRYKWEPYRDTNWQCIDYFLPRGGHTFAKVSR